MTQLDPTRVIFVGSGTTPSAWFRCALPALQLGADWCGVLGDPPDVEFVTGGGKRRLSLDALADYDVVVLQRVSSGWIPLVERLQAGGTTVLYDIDEDLRGLNEHSMEEFRDCFNDERVAHMELALAACDGVLVPTRYLAERYRELNPRTWVCRNGVDLGRFALTRTPDPNHVVIGFAGYAGHNDALVPWLHVVARVMRKHPHVRFHSLGVPFAELLEKAFPGRVLALPWSDVISFPAGMVDFDVALAPAGSSSWFRGKSDLRWLEASALEIATVADPFVYHEIEHGVTGFHAGNEAALERVLTRLVTDPELRTRVGAAASAHVRAHRTIAAVAGDWRTALTESTLQRVPEAA